MKVIKKVLKNNVFCFILGAFIFGVIGVSAATYFASSDVTYDNSESGLSSTDVQGAIDELYNTCVSSTPSASDTIIDLLPSNTDELYKDDKENIRYYGANPNNYVTFNNELWRIIGVIDGKIKIIRNESIGEMAWNTSYNNNWNNSSLKNYLNGSYYNSIIGTYKEMISKEIFYFGGPSQSIYESLTASRYYEMERSNNVDSGNPITIEQYIGLMYPSDYGYASGSSNCLTTALFDYGDACYLKNYLYSGITEWLQTPFSNSPFTYVADLLSWGRLNRSYPNDVEAVRPVLYLTSDTQIVSGNGSQENSFKLSL